MSEIGSCCTSTKPCKLNQGDCDSDNDCDGDLICGTDNCGSSFTSSSTDCCREKRNLKNNTIILTTRRNYKSRTFSNIFAAIP